MIRISRGLDLTIPASPKGPIKQGPISTHSALDLTSFNACKFVVLANVGENVKKGQALVEDKETKGRMFVSPASGVIREIIRGAKRRILYIVIERLGDEQVCRTSLDPERCEIKDLVDRMKEAGAFATIFQRPCKRLADPSQLPDAVFIKAIESAPLTTPPELQVEGLEEEFRIGLRVLERFAPGKVFLVHGKNSCSKEFTEAGQVKSYEAVGPHPIANPSVHIAHLHPIRNHKQVIWTLGVLEVINLGSVIGKGKISTKKVVGLAGEAVLPEHRGYYRVENGLAVNDLLNGKILGSDVRLISGDPLMGSRVEKEGYLGFFDTTLCAIPEQKRRRLLHFMRPSTRAYCSSPSYVGGQEVTTGLHGEVRPFVDGAYYDKVFPFKVPPVLLVKALLAENYPLAVELGLLEIEEEDFSLPTYICPSKIDMVRIVREGIARYREEYL